MTEGQTDPVYFKLTQLFMRGEITRSELLRLSDWRSPGVSDRYREARDLVARLEGLDELELLIPPI